MVLGFLILCVGIWAWTEKDTFNNLSRMTHVPMDPAFLFIIVGTITFIIGFTGCVGALRENTCLLAFYSISLALLLLLEMTAGVLCFIFKDWFKQQATNGFRAFIIHYRDDPDQQNLIDWIQADWLKCCGIEGPEDWESNQYFNCSAKHVGSVEACGVPFSCCRPRKKEFIRNKQCGYNVRNTDFQEDYAKIVYDRGCLAAGEAWVNTNLTLVAGVVIAVAFLQILGICFAQNLRADIFAQMAKWR